VTSELDIYRVANILVREYGPEQAPLMAARRADTLLELRDLEGLATWKAILRAVLELTRTELGPDDRVN
jgi:hypothetical protein